VGLGDDLSGQVEPLAEVVETLGGEGVVVVLPREAGLDVAAAGQRLASLDDVKVLGVDVAVLGKVEVLLSDENALCGDRVSACPYMQRKAAKKMYKCAIAMARARKNTNLGRGTWGGIVSMLFMFNCRERERGNREQLNISKCTSRRGCETRALEQCAAPTAGEN